MRSSNASLHAPLLAVLPELLQRARLPNAGLLLDLACGSGQKWPLLHAAAPHARWLAIDLDQHAVRAHPPHAQRIAADAHALPLPNNVLAGATCIAGFGGFSAPGVALRELRRVLRPNAPALLVTAERRWAAVTTPDAVHIAAYRSARARGVAAFHAHPDVAGDLVARCVNAGFSVVQPYAFAYERAADPLEAELTLLPETTDDIELVSVLLVVVVQAESER